MAAAFIAALFLSFLCGLFYNFWLDSIEGTKLEDGDWHGRIMGELSKEDLETVRLFANVEKAVINETLSEGQETTIDVYFYDKRTIYQDMKALIDMLGLNENAADYNYQLLSLYFIRIPGDEMPRLLMPAYLAVVVLVCFSLILVIHNSFAVSMNNRVHQFGIFSSIGATPGQIRICLVQEALMLAIVPIMIGILAGVFFSFGTIRAMSAFAADLAGGRAMEFGLHPLILVVIFLLSVFTILISAWNPARKLSRLTPLEAIKGTGELCLKKKKRSWILSALFGMEGELAGNALKAQKKALRTTSLSLTLAFLGFMLMQCFFTLSGISTNHTYFEAYQDVWDIMLTIKDTKIEEFELAEEVQKIQEEQGAQRVQGIKSSVIYQKAEAVSIIPAESISAELLALGGLEVLAGIPLSDEENGYLVKTPIVILDDNSFMEYCKQVDITPKLNGTILLNQIWDSKNSNFRYPEYLPYIKEDIKTVTIRNAAEGAKGGWDSSVELSVLTCTQECPVLREEYEKSDYPLVEFMPLSLWKEVAGQIEGAEKDLYIRVLAEDRESLEALNALEDDLIQELSADYEIESENRMQEKLDNDKMIRGYELILGTFCVLLALIGIAHVFSHTLGFLRQRRREFARYMSVGLTPEGMRKIFCIEALVIVGRPVLITLGLTTVATAYIIKISYLNPVEFIREAPVLPIAVFILTVFGFVALAYYLGGKKILQVNLSEALRDDTMV